jgi:biofilm PGA synthesis N-glycosyltransferase PgaC
MNRLEILFWLCAGIVFYSFLGYGILLLVWAGIKQLFRPAAFVPAEGFEPSVSLIIPCYNEAAVLEEKIANCRSIRYPADKLTLIFITDGSTDGSVSIIEKHPEIRLLHLPERKGKTAAENRAMQFVQTPIVIFSDANTLLNPEAIRQMVSHFADEHTGCVAGEKKIAIQRTANAGTAGEGIYWRYESRLKKLDYLCNSAVGAAGELVAFRTALYQPLPEDTILDDFMQSMQIAAAGYRIVYESKAFATEKASANVQEELIRKIRIATGSWQAMKRLRGILRWQKTPLLCFQYFSRRILRWAVTPFLLIVLVLLNLLLWIEGKPLYELLFYTQACFYLAAWAGYLFRNHQLARQWLFVPYYFCMMHYAAFAGWIQYHTRKNLNGIWEKASRSDG